MGLWRIRWANAPSKNAPPSNITNSIKKNQRSMTLLPFKTGYQKDYIVTADQTKMG
jgi:hypothetical protein